MNDKAKHSLMGVVDQFKSGDLSPIIDTIKFIPPDNIPSSKWSLSNRILSFSQSGHYDCRGFRQWQSAGRFVKKGSQASYILGPRMIKDEDENGDEIKVLAGYVSIAVFGLDDTDGDELDGIVYTPVEFPPLFDVAAKWGIDVRYLPIPKNAYGSFNPWKSVITLGTHSMETWFHELAHAAHSQIEDLIPGQDPHQETIADFTACVLMKLYTGKDYSGNTWAYIDAFNSDPLKAIFKALSTVEKIVSLLIET